MALTTNEIALLVTVITTSFGAILISLRKNIRVCRSGCCELGFRSNTVPSPLPPNNTTIEIPTSGQQQQPLAFDWPTPPTRTPPNLPRSAPAYVPDYEMVSFPDPRM